MEPTVKVHVGHQRQEPQQRHAEAPGVALHWPCIQCGCKWLWKTSVGKIKQTTSFSLNQISFDTLYSPQCHWSKKEFGLSKLGPASPRHQGRNWGVPQGSPHDSPPSSLTVQIHAVPYIAFLSSCICSSLLRSGTPNHEVLVLGKS